MQQVCAACNATYEHVRKRFYCLDPECVKARRKGYTRAYRGTEHGKAIRASYYQRHKKAYNAYQKEYRKAVKSGKHVPGSRELRKGTTLDLAALRNASSRKP